MLERLFIFLMVIFTIGFSTGVSSARQVELKSNYNTSVQHIGLNSEETNWLAHKKTLVVGTGYRKSPPLFIKIAVNIIGASTRIILR